SPLIRAKETAEILAPGQAITEEPALIEMDWGAWEGQRLRDIRRTDPEGLAAAEARGRDITPPGGESPRQVWTRLEGFLRSIAPTGQPGQDLRLVAVCHKGVMRALMAEACNWDMTGPPPINPARSEALLFRIAPGGAPFDWVEPVSLMPEEA
ncbi:MAG: histidine phosphatase family protein, partial [Rhodospirillaceae bacterium]